VCAAACITGCAAAMTASAIGHAKREVFGSMRARYSKRIRASNEHHPPHVRRILREHWHDYDAPTVLMDHAA
jgi:hypothetical protein